MTRPGELVSAAGRRLASASEARPLLVSIDGGKAEFNVAEHLTDEKAVMMVELYRHSSGWKCGTIAAGFAGGLASLIGHFGGEVADAPVPARILQKNSRTPAGAYLSGEHEGWL